jgi:membrane-associated PAP2 superfamily phosphatase
LSATPPGRRDAAVLALTLLALLAWDASGLDLPVSALFADGHGFALRNAWWTSTLLHDGGRWLSWAVFGLLLVDLVRPWLPGPSRRERGWALGAVLLSVLAVPALKRLSSTSCPWDRAVFGGVGEHVPHWQFWLSDGGPGHCFPSGHAVAAFGFIGLYHLWRGHRPALARALLAGVLVAGALFGTAQLLRGAHAVSHTLWSAWLCLLIAGVASALQRRLAPAAAASEHRVLAPLVRRLPGQQRSVV